MSILVVIRLKFFKDFRSLLIKLLSTNYLLQNDWVNVNQSLQIACLGEICQTEGSYLSTLWDKYCMCIIVPHHKVFNETFFAKLRGTSQILLVKNCVIQRTQFEEMDLMNCFIIFCHLSNLLWGFRCAELMYSCTWYLFAELEILDYCHPEIN